MGIFDFLLGKPEQTVMDARSQQARDFILNELDKVYAQGPINVPKYFAQVPEAAYSGTNNLLTSLGMDTVQRPYMGDNVANIGGMDVYTSDLLQNQMEQDFASRNPSLYNELMGNTAPTASFTDVSAASGGGGGGGGGSDPYHGGDSVADCLDPNNRMGLAEHMARQERNYAEGVSDGAMGFAQTPDGGVYAVGYKEGQMSPREAAERGFVMKDKNPFDLTFGEHMGQIGTDVVVGPDAGVVTDTLALSILPSMLQTHSSSAIFTSGEPFAVKLAPELLMALSHAQTKATKA